MKPTKTAALRLMALSGLLPLLYVISYINTLGYPLAEPSFPQLILSAGITLLTTAVLICGIIGGIFLTAETKSFAALFFTMLSGVMLFFLIFYISIIFGTENPLYAAFGLGDFARFSFGLTSVFYAVFLFSFAAKENRKCKIFSAAYGAFGIVGIIQYILIMVLGNRTEGGSLADPSIYSLFTMDALAVTCVIPAILGIILLILVWKTDFFSEE